MSKISENSSIYKDIITSVSDFFCIIDKDGNIIEYFLPESCLIFKNANIKNYKLYDLQLTAKARNEIKKSLNNVRLNKQEYSFLFFQFIENEKHYFEARFLPNNENITVIFRDITNIKKIENVQKQLKLYYQNILERNQRGIVETDKSGKIIYYNSHFCNLINKRTLTDTNFFELLNISERKDEILYTLQENKDNIAIIYIKYQYNEFKITFLYNKKIFINETYLYIEVEDVSEIKRNEKLLHRSESTYRNLVELLPSGVIIRDETKVLFANKKALEIIGYLSVEDIIEVDIETLCLPEYIESIRERNALLKQHKELPYIEIKIKRPIDNKIIEIETVTTLVNYLGNEAYQVIFRDVSEEKNLLKTKLRADIAEENYKKLRNEVIKRQQIEQQLSKSLEEKSILLKEVHHRVKNNLQIISSIINLEKKSINDNSSKNVLNKVQNRINSIYLVHEMIYQTDNFSRIDFKRYIVLIVENMIRCYEYSKVNINYELENIFLPLDLGVPCGMIMNENLYNYFNNIDLFVDNQEIIIKLYIKELYVIIEILYPDLQDELEDMSKIHTFFSMQLLDALVDQIGGEYTLGRSSTKKINFILQFKI